MISLKEWLVSLLAIFVLGVLGRLTWDSGRKATALTLIFLAFAVIAYTVYRAGRGLFW